MMNKRTVWFSVLLAMTFLFDDAVAQEKQLSSRGGLLKESLEKLQRNPRSKLTQERYLAAFPKDYDSFLELFEPDKELYDGHEYIAILPRLARKHERVVGELLIGLSKDAHYDADAPGYLQHATSTYGSRHTRMFVELLKTLPAGKQAQLIAFLADVENPAADPEYQCIIYHLLFLGDKTLAERFEIARRERSRQPHG